jgi:aryl-alcohol dehydrogenase-like predicted oxidoreductase
MNTLSVSNTTAPIGGRQVGRIGLGCMNLSHGYGTPPPPEEGRTVIRRALELGVTHFDTAALYGVGRNEMLVGEALGADRAGIHLASKCGFTVTDGRPVVDGDPAALRRTCHESLARLKTERIDLYYLHRWDRRVPIEACIETLADLVREGLIGGIGLSEVSAATLERAHAVHPITAVQSEYSLWNRTPELGVLDACRRLGVAFVAYSPLTRAFLLGGVPDPEQLAPRDFRRELPRFSEPHFSRNRPLVGAFQALAAEAGLTPAQLALGWVLSRGPHVIAIPGTTSIAHLEDNVAAQDLRIAPEVLVRADALVSERTVSGDRYSEAAFRAIDTERFPA